MSRGAPQHLRQIHQQLQIATQKQMQEQGWAQQHAWHVDWAGIRLRKSVNFFDFRVINFGGSILWEKHVPWNFITKLTEPTRQIKTAFPMNLWSSTKVKNSIPPVKLRARNGGRLWDVWCTGEGYEMTGVLQLSWRFEKYWRTVVKN